MTKPRGTHVETAAQTVSHPAFWRSSFEVHAGAVLAFLVSRLGRRDLAEDLLQETFVKAIRAGALRDAAKTRSYLLSIAYRLVVDRSRRPRPVLFSEMVDGETLVEVPDEAVPSPAAAAEGAWARQRLQTAVAGLREPLQVAFVAAVLEQRSYAEIAEENGWSAGQVRVNVHRARKQVIARMRELLQIDPGDEP